MTEIRTTLENVVKLLQDAITALPLPAPDAPSPTDVWADLVSAAAKSKEIPDRLRPVCLAQAIAESGRGDSNLARQHLNFWGMKWRPEMEDVAVAVLYDAHDGREEYCKFPDVATAIKGWWRFLQRSPYVGHLDKVLNPAAWIQFIGPTWCPPGYEQKYLNDHEGRDYDDEIMRLTEETTPLLVAQGWNPPRVGNDEMGAMKAWIPYAKDWLPRHAQRGKYRNGFPEGAVIHYGAGSSMEGTMSTGNSSGYTFLGIDREGTIWQSCPLSHWGYHSGTSHHETCVGIELDAAGTLTLLGGKWTAWFGKSYDAAATRTIHAKNANQYPGTYHEYTGSQETALVELMMWMKAQAPGIFDFDKVVGHDEACVAAGFPGRKVDPGGALSMTMPEFRKFLKEEWNRRNA
jgi:hypothetical protein